MSVNVFVDSNVLVYSRDASEPEKQLKAMVWMTHLWTSKTGRLSFQVLIEFYVTVTQKLQPGMDIHSARDDVRSLLVWDPIPLGEGVLQGAWFIQDRFNLSWLESLIVSAAQAGDCRYLISEKFQQNLDFGGVRVVDPFLYSPESLNL